MDHQWRISMRDSAKLHKNHPLYAPGLSWRKRASGSRIPMWIPPTKDVKAGYAPKSLMLDRDALPLNLAAACRRQWKDLTDWRESLNITKPPKLTIGWLIDHYLSDEHSPYQKLKPDTQQSYGWECKRLRETIGERRLDPKLEGGMLVPRIVGEDIRRWHFKWGHPEGGTPTPSRATHCIAMLRTLISYAVEMGVVGSVEIRARLNAMRFEKPGARLKAATYTQVDAIVDKAVEMGFRSVAITTLAQYELIERRAHIIGQWHGETWNDGWIWEGVSPDWVISYYQTKKGRQLRSYDLKPVQRLLGLMQETPKEQRTGPIIICEATGRPWLKRRYQEQFRAICRAAGVPDDLYSMDMRSGGATEADAIPEVTDRMLQDGGGWRDPNMPQRYRRKKQDNANNVVRLRQEKRDRP